MNAPVTPPTFLAEQLSGALGTFLEHNVLPQWIHARRWFRSKTHPIRGVALEAVFACDAGDVNGADAVFTVLRVTFTEGTDERYALPLALIAPGLERDLPEAAIIGPVQTPAGERILIDGCWHEGFRARLYELLASHNDIASSGGTLRGRPASATPFPAMAHGSSQETVGGMPQTSGLESRVLSAEQSNTSLVFGEGVGAVFVKLYRRLDTGVHPEPEMLRFLSEHTTFRHAPEFLSALEWVEADGKACTAALAQEFLSNAADAWSFLLEGLRAAGREGARAGLPEDLRATAALIGRRVGEFHLAAASQPEIPAFAPEPFTAADADTARARARDALAEGVSDLESLLAAPPLAYEADARRLVACRDRLERLLDDAVNAVDSGSTGLKIRTHGDLHLGQILIHHKGPVPDVRLLDFEGEPGRPLAAGREKQSPLRDVAGMLRSFHYAAHASILLNEPPEGGAPRGLDPEAMAAALCASFLDEYFTALDTVKKIEGDGILPATTRTCRALLDLFVLEKATYELQYECNNRPDWTIIPLRGLLALCESKS